MRVSTDNDRQVIDLQRDALLAVGVDGRHLYEDRASGSRSDRSGLSAALAFLQRGITWWSGSLTGWVARCRISWKQ